MRGRADITDVHRSRELAPYQRAGYLNGPNGPNGSVRGNARGRATVYVGAAALPTYATVADVLEKKNGSGWRLFGWTILRVVMIAPPMMAVGVPVKLAFQGAALSSALISLFTMIRISETAKAQGVRI